MFPNDPNLAAGQALREAIFHATSIDNLIEDAPIPNWVSLPLLSIPGFIPAANFNVLSLNVCSLPGHYDDLHALLSTLELHLFDVLLLQEVWSIHSSYPIPGYHPIVTSTRDQNGVPNWNCWWWEGHSGPIQASTGVVLSFLRLQDKERRRKT